MNYTYTDTPPATQDEDSEDLVLPSIDSFSFDGIVKAIDPASNSRPPQPLRSTLTRDLHSNNNTRLCLKTLCRVPNYPQSRGRCAHRNPGLD